MSPAKLQAALRELQDFLSSWRYWATIALVILVFTVTGPFGTGDRMPVLQRLSFWALLHIMAFTTALLMASLVDVILQAKIRSRLARMMLGSSLAAVPIGFAIVLLQAGFFGSAVTVSEFAEQVRISLPLCLLLCLLTYLTSGEPQQALKSEPGSKLQPEREAESEADPKPEADVAPIRQEPPCPEGSSGAPPLLLRLKPESRGRLHRLSVQDHYTQVVTSRGSQLILLRFADALNETGAIAGQRIHRSHWVAEDQVKGLAREGGRLIVETMDGARLPVSRPYEAAIRARFGRPMAATTSKERP